MRPGWENRPLREICSVFGRIGFRGYTKADFVSSPDDGAITLSPSNIIGGELSCEKCSYVSWEKYNQSPEIMIFPGDILLVKTASIGKCALVRSLPHEATINPQFVVLKDIKANHQYLTYFLQSPAAQDKFQEFAIGAAIPTFSQKKLEGLVVPIPSLPEQQRIVDILDQEFAKIDALKANAEKAIQAAKDLFISALSKELKHREGWKETRIGDFCEIIRGKRFVRADMVEEGVPCIHYGDIYTHYGLFATKAKGCVPPDLAKKLRFANKNDVIVVAAGENRMDIGVGVAWLGEEPAVVHDACFILKHSQNPMFLSYYFRSAEYHQYLKDEVNEGKICSFLTKPLAEARISLPTLEEQEQIVKRLGIVSPNCKAMQDDYQKTLSLCDDLKQSLLRKAFNGEL